ncbi:MAG: hypothetical protein RR212_04885 [Bacteroidales bacterium]
MKRHVQFPGIRKWSGDDLMELQGEGLSIADRFFSQYGNCVICGCTVSDGDISAGLVAIGGLVMPFEAATGIEVFPVYLIKAEKHVQREYADDVVRDIAVEYYAKKVQEKPTGDYIEITATGAPVFFDMIKSTWLTGILDQLTDLKNKDKDISDAIELIKTGDTATGDRLVKLEKKMPSLLDHSPTVDDDNFDIGVEVWTVAANGAKTFWKCHDNAKGAAVWKPSGEGGGGSGSYGGAVYLTGQTDFSKASILIKNGYLQ